MRAPGALLYTISPKLAFYSKSAIWSKRNGALRISVTRSDKVFQGLASDILSGKLEPGKRLDEPSICRQFDVSRTPVREALRRLSGTGLVEMLPRKGVTVAQIDVKSLTEMFEALAEFEGLCARLCASRMTTFEKKRLEMLNKDRETRIAQGEKDLAVLNNEFHEIIYEGCHSPSIAGVTRNFRRRLAPFKSLQFVRGRTKYSFDQHDEIAAAILASDPELAYLTMRDHVANTGFQVIEHFAAIAGESVKKIPA
jgi:DNA-binding GntR family transcriptional regulator